nr:MAG TPA: hypothetical protein [Caudoviricetes sp.]
MGMWAAFCGFERCLKKSLKKFCSFKNSAYLCSVQEMVVTYFAGQAVNLLNISWAFFIPILDI